MVIKCKMCGGDLHPEVGCTTCECEFCGTVQTIPSDDGEKKTNLFNRANYLRMNAEFDKAASVYESIVAEFPSEAEAYWGLCLCSYGIEYVDDPTTGEKKATCHRTLPSSIMEDINFEQACDYADAIARRVYREEAKAIDRIQNEILEIVTNEEPYDVFICYKETAEEGGRTEDSIISQEIFDVLTEKGLKVFFAKITLEDKLGQQYEPYIYAALSSAKVMLAVGTKFEYYDAVWVKNEWMRFLSMMKTEKGKTLIPCYKDLDAYDMPKEFRNLQGQDMSKLGWLQDLTRGVMKLCGKENNQSVSGQPSGNMYVSSPTVDSLLKRGFVFLEDKKWDSAKEYADKVLDIDVENAQAYLIKLMADLHVSKRDDLREQSQSFGQNEHCQKIFRFGDEQIIDEIKGIILFINERNETNQKKKREADEKVSELEKEFTDAKEAVEKNQKAVIAATKQKEKASAELRRLESEHETLQADLIKLTGFFNRKKKAEAEDRLNTLQVNIKRAQEDVKTAEDDLATTQNNKPEPPKNELVYQLAAAYCEANRYQDAYRYFKTIRGYKDVDELLQNVEGLRLAATHEAKTASFRTVGNEVSFGHYNLWDSGDNKEDRIPWIVLKAEGSKALLISKYGIDAQQYHTSSTGEITWEKSSLRKWLNTEFISKGFSSDEQNAIISSKIDNSESQGHNSSEQFRQWGISLQARICYGPTTSDKVFLLSYKEAKQLFSTNKDRMCKPSEYAKQRGKGVFPPTVDGAPVSIGKQNGYGQWWLRTAEYEYDPIPGNGDVGLVANIVSADGECTSVLSTGELMIRPTIWINLDSEYFMSADNAEGLETSSNNQENKLDSIINSLSECTRAQDMIQKLDTMGLPHDSTEYQQVLETLKNRAQIERMYGVNHDQTVIALTKIR